MPLEAIKAKNWLYFFIILHLIAWTLVPALTRYNLPMDSIEGATWGHQLEWGYDKNPFLNGWLTALAVYVDGYSGWMIYLFSQLSVAICFLSIWFIAREMLSPIYALISVMLLEGMQYYNLHAIDFNDNTLELGLWALTSYFFYQALRTPTYRFWLLTSLFAALGMMTKYYTAMLLLGMIFFLFTRRENRRQLLTFPPYAALLLFIAIILPHTIWLFFHDFITVTYVFARTSSEPHWTNHFFFPLQFAWQQWEVCLPALGLVCMLITGQRPVLSSTREKMTAFNIAFLWWVGVSPFLFTLLLSFCLGIKLRAGWGMPLLSLWGILLMAYLQPCVTPTKLYRFISSVFALMAFLLTGYSLSLIYSASPTSANFPGDTIATSITYLWHDRYHTPLTYVAGSRWVGGNISFYSPDHPAVFIQWDKQHAPWIDQAELQKKGGVFIWEISNHEKLPASVRNTFPQLSDPMTLTYAWKRNHYPLEPIQIGVAFLPPSNPS